MKLLLDMGLSPRTAVLLREHGYDAVHLIEEDLQCMPDIDIIQKAEKEGRIILTFDLDFSRILALQRLAGPSVILFRLQEFTTDLLNEMIIDLLKKYRQSLEKGAILVIDPNRLRLRSLPVW